MHSRDVYSSRLQELSREEADIERRLAERQGLLSSNEVNELNSRLTGVRVEKEQIDQIVTGAFF